jgi:hypothetical protein
VIDAIWRIASQRRIKWGRERLNGIQEVRDRNVVKKPTKKELIAHYRREDPKRFIVYDGSIPHEDGDIHAQDGKVYNEDDYACVRYIRYELLYDAFPVKVFIRPGIDTYKAAHLLEYIAAWIKKDGLPTPSDTNDSPF